MPDFLCRFLFIYSNLSVHNGYKFSEIAEIDVIVLIILHLSREQ